MSPVPLPGPWLAPSPCHRLRYHVTSSATMSPAPLPGHQLRCHVIGSATMSPSPLPCFCTTSLAPLLRDQLRYQ
eukprot:3191592-Karenia_brevis.AAC.1